MCSLCIAFEELNLAVSKLAAGREKDTEFVRAMARRGLVAGETLKERLARAANLRA